VTSEFVRIDIGGDSISKWKDAARFTAVIPPSSILSNYKNISVRNLRLYNNYYGTEDSSLLAEIELNDDEKIDFGDNYSSYTIMIEWYMYFDNPSPSSNSGNSGDNV
jgi:hypothetical protein